MQTTGTTTATGACFMRVVAIALSTFYFSQNGGILLFADAAKPIHDPLNIFCGSESCYDILGVNQSSSLKDIKKAYRQMSLSQHPDRNRAENATAVFQTITKAFEVLTGNESRSLFDYYLAHPRDYFTVSGQHYYQNLPKSDVTLVLTVTLLLLTWLLYTIQFQKYQRAVKYLTTASSQNLGLKNGGTKQTQELYRRAVEMYEKHIKEVNSSSAGASSSSKKERKEAAAKGAKMQKDPVFLKFIDQVVSEVKIEGGYRKPEWRDLLAVQLCMSPYFLYQFSLKYYRRYISSVPLSLEEKLEMVRETVGLATWEEMPEKYKLELVERRIWLSAEHSKWLAEIQELEDSAYVSAAAAAAAGAGKKKSKRKGKRDSEDDLDYID